MIRISIHEIPHCCVHARANALMEEPARNIALHCPTHTALSSSIHGHYGSILNTVHFESCLESPQNHMIQQDGRDRTHKEIALYASDR